MGVDDYYSLENSRVLKAVLCCTHIFPCQTGKFGFFIVDIRLVISTRNVVFAGGVVSRETMPITISDFQNAEGALRFELKYAVI
jgi:hypothetical protein